MSRVVLALMWLMHWLPLRVIAWIGNAVGALLYWLIPERRRVTRINLEKCFPHMSAAQRERLARAAFRAFCRGFVDRAVLWWAPPARIKRMVRLVGIEHLDAAGPRVVLLVPLFGVPAATAIGLSYIARTTGAAVVPCVARMLPAGGYVAQFYPAWTGFPCGDEVADARRMMAFIEERVLEMPEQYHWMHKRFKTRPEGEPRFY